IRGRARPPLGVDIQWGAVDGVAARRVAAVGPVEEAILEIELEIDRLGQAVEQHFDVGAIRRALPGRKLDLSAKDAAQSRVIRAFLRPVDLSAAGIDGDADAPLR